MFKIRTANIKLFLVFFAAIFISSAFVFLSPGNFTREGSFSHHFQLIHSLEFASLQTIRFIGKWCLSIPFVALSLVIIRKSDSVQNLFLKKFDYRIILPLLLFTVFMGSFIPYFATGMLGQHRTINYVFFYFLLLWPWFLVSVSERFSLQQKLSAWIGEKHPFFLALAAVVVMILSGNGINILRDFKMNRWAEYRTEFITRQKQIIANPGSGIEPLKKVPITFQIVDAKNDSTWWVNICMAKFYSETKIELK
jgi:hypothetical protein